MRRLARILPVVLLAACAATQRDCSSCSASTFGSDWIVLQYGASGEPINCWRLLNTAIDNESHTDGIYWRDPSGHLVHISGWYNRVQVEDKKFDEAAFKIGVDLARCVNGKYAAGGTTTKSGGD